MAKRLTTEGFIEKAEGVHGKRYGYGLVNYEHSKKKVPIICPEHGVFAQRPADHLSGKGCPVCAVESRAEAQRFGLGTFIAKAEGVHGKRYDYSSVTSYAGARKKVPITCREHGVFEQTPNSHLSGRGCPICAVESRAEAQRYDVGTFICKAKEVHGERYDYSSVTSYVNANKKVPITCREHGIFEQTPDHHLRGYGCPVCAGNLRSDVATFVYKAKEVHGERYDYSSVTSYVDAHTKVPITCPEHGIFEQTPAQHLSGRGCPKCSTSKGEETVCALLDSLEITYAHNRATPFSQKKRYDFIIESPKLIIERDGEQHFRPVSFGVKCPERVNENFLKTQQNDRLKDRLAVDNGYSMFRIPYWVTELERALQLILETPTPSPAVYRLNQDDEGNVFLETLHLEECDDALPLAA